MARFGQALKPPKPLQQLSKALAPHRSGLNELSIYLSFYLSIYLSFYLSIYLSPSISLSLSLQDPTIVGSAAPGR